MCPTGSLGDRFAREVVRAGRWAVQRGELRLELSGDVFFASPGSREGGGWRVKVAIIANTDIGNYDLN